MPLEDYGGSGTAGSHWDRSVVYNEYMTGWSTRDSIFSNLTLALFQDTGWYIPNWEVGETLLFGKNAGCNFL